MRDAPSSNARVGGRLRFLTSDDQAELYLVLASAQLASGQTWVRVSLPGRPNGQRGWAPRAALGPLHAVNGYLLIDRAPARDPVSQRTRDLQRTGGGREGHGTSEPQLIPGRPSHGCIRMRNADISRLWRQLSLGTPIEIV